MIEIGNVLYKEPRVELLHATPLYVAEVAGRTAYNSFEKSEHEKIREWKGYQLKDDIESSEILNSLAWVHHHHSVLELINISFSIKDTSRGVLQEFSRHRIQSLTVKSTRYTMSDILNAFIASYITFNDYSLMFNSFVEIVRECNIDFLVILEEDEVEIELRYIFEKLLRMINKIGEEEFLKLSLSKENIEFCNCSVLSNTNIEVFNELKKGKVKRNVGDNFKNIVTDCWTTEIVFNMNLRSLKNFLNLRNSGSAYPLMRELAIAIQSQVPKKYLDLIVRDK